MTPDVVVIGGGPAGLSAAIVLARHGIATTLVERGTFPIDKPCGEGLLPNGVEALERLGVTCQDLEPCGHPIAGIRYYSAAGRSAEARFDGGAGIGIRRTHLSSLLVDRARQLPALSVVTGTPAGVRLLPGARPEVAIGAERLCPRLVIAADGLMSHTRRACGIDSTVGRQLRWGLRQHVDVAPWTDHVEVYFGQSVEAYVTPLDEGINVAFLWRKGPVDRPDQMSAFAAFTRAVPALARRLAGARALDRVRAAGPFLQTPRERARDGLLLVGDAAGYVDAITGEGVGLAFAQAEALASTLVPVLEIRGADVISAAAMAPFLAESDRVCRSNRQLTELLLRLARRPEIVERVISALARDPALFQHCLKVNMGLASPFRPPLKSLVKLVGGMGRLQALDPVRPAPTRES